MNTLVLLGAGHAHLYVLEAIARCRQGSDPKNPWPDGWRVVLVTPSLKTVYSGMVPGCLEGRYQAEDCHIHFGWLLEAAQVQWIQGSVYQLDADHQKVHYAAPNGGSGLLGYDLLSINTGGTMDRNRINSVMPGARTHALFLRPIEQMLHHWPALLTLAYARAEQAEVFRIAVIGAGAAGVELACTIRTALPLASISVVAGEFGPASAYPKSFQKQVRRILKARSVQVIEDRCVGISDGYLTLASGAQLSCDAPIIATGSQAPQWLTDSAARGPDVPANLALDGQGFLIVNSFQQVLNRPNIFAAGDIASRADRAHQRSGVYAVRAGHALAVNLLRSMRGQALVAHKPPAATLNILNCGDGTALAHYGAWGLNWVARGAWVMRWKDRIDRRFIARFSTA